MEDWAIRSGPSVEFFLHIEVKQQARSSQDWKTITKLLQTEKAKDELSESDATNLVRLLNASVKKVRGESLVKETTGKAAHLTKAQKVRNTFPPLRSPDFDVEKQVSVSKFMGTLRVTELGLLLDCLYGPL